MPSKGNFLLNRKYRIEFFDLQEDGTIIELTNLNSFSIQLNDPLQFTFDYQIGFCAFNTANFKFYNLSKNSINTFSGTNSKRGFRLLTWYEAISGSPSAIQLIFEGLVFRTTTYRQNTDLITEVIGCDAIFNLGKKRLSKTYKKGTPTIEILNDISILYDGVYKFVGTELLTSDIKCDYCINNKSFDDILDDLCRDNGGISYGSIFNTIYFNDQNVNGNIKGNTITITPTSGMIGNVRPEGISTQFYLVDYFSKTNLNKNNPWLSVSILLRRVTFADRILLMNTEFEEFNNKFYSIIGITHSGGFRNPELWQTSLKIYNNE